jgi:DNA-binding NarL/FixJ family response regulator
LPPLDFALIRVTLCYVTEAIERNLLEAARADRKAAGWIERRNTAIARAHAEGASYRDIANVCQLSHMTVKRIIEGK